MRFNRQGQDDWSNCPACGTGNSVVALKSIADSLQTIFLQGVEMGLAAAPHTAAQNTSCPFTFNILT